MEDSNSEQIQISEIEKVQNPALGALLMWHYGCKYQDQTSSEASSALLFFLVLPICFHKRTLDVANSTLPKSGLGKFCEKLGDSREELFAIHERALKLRQLSYSSISLGLRSGLLTVNYETGSIRANNHKPPSSPDRIKPLIKGVERLGIWFQTLEPGYIFKVLKLEA